MRHPVTVDQWLRGPAAWHDMPLYLQDAPQAAEVAIEKIEERGDWMGVDLLLSNGRYRAAALDHLVYFDDADFIEKGEK